MSDPWKATRRLLLERLAPWMFGCSFAFLALLAALIVLVIDVPRFDETVALYEDAEGSVVGNKLALDRELAYEALSHRWGLPIGVALLALWPVFWAEVNKDFWLRDRSRAFSDQHRFAWLQCLFPPLRLCKRDREEADRVWLPTWGWQTVDFHLRKRLERAFSVPMALVALLILPVLALQFILTQTVADHPWLRFLLHFSTGLIWFCFAIEFIMRISVAHSKLNYCKRHWLDLLIIVLPLASFLRSLQALRATKLLKAAKLQQLGRLVRVYRLRGVTMRGFRAILLLGVFNRLSPASSEKRLVRLRRELSEKEHEIEDLRRQIANLESQSKIPLSQANQDRREPKRNEC